MYCVISTYQADTSNGLETRQKIEYFGGHKDGAVERYYGRIEPGYEERPTLVTLQDYKTALNKVVDEETRNNIFAGFVFDGVLISMSETAQINWTNFPLIPEAKFPYRIKSKDSQSFYTLTFANRNAFWGAALEHKSGCLQAGNDKVEQVNSCTTIQEVQDLAASWYSGGAGMRTANLPPDEQGASVTESLLAQVNSYEAKTEEKKAWYVVLWERIKSWFN